MVPVVLGVLFFVLLLMPVGVGLYWYRRNDQSVLPVRQDRTRDPRYFAKSFDSIFDKAWNAREGDMLLMSRPERFLFADQVDYSQEVTSLVVEPGPEFVPPIKSVFEREVVSRGRAHIACDTRMRALRAHGGIILEDGVCVERWVDADGVLAVYDNCELGISATSAVLLTVGKNVMFRRLYAPMIAVGFYPGDDMKPRYQRDPRIYRLGNQDDKLDGRRHISAADVDEEGIARSSFVTEGRVVVDEDLIVMGCVRARGGLHVADRAVVCGSVFAEDEVFFGEDSTILGSVFTQGDVHLSRGVVVGQEGRVCSVVARGSIYIEQGCIIYGYVSSEVGGVTWRIHEGDDPVDVPCYEYVAYPDAPQPVTELRFVDAADFEKMDSEGYRNNAYLVSVVVPEGVTRIPDSMFFHCENLQSVHLPSSLVEIGEYTFADCVSLVSVNWGDLDNLFRLGRSAFDGCTSLEQVVLPPSVERLENAAFYGCQSLMDFSFDHRPREVGTHCFIGCPIDEPFTSTQSVAGFPVDFGNEVVDVQ